VPQSGFDVNQSNPALAREPWRSRVFACAVFFGREIEPEGEAAIDDVRFSGR